MRSRIHIFKKIPMLLQLLLVGETENNKLYLKTILNGMVSWFGENEERQAFFIYFWLGVNTDTTFLEGSMA